MSVLLGMFFFSLFKISYGLAIPTRPSQLRLMVPLNPSFRSTLIRPVWSENNNSVFLRVLKEFYQSHDNKFLLSELYCSFLIERKLLNHSREGPKKTLRQIISVKPPACFYGLSVRFPVAKESLSRTIFTSVKDKTFLASKSSLFQLCL